MRSPVFIALVLVVVNGALWRFREDAAREHAELADSVGGLSASTDEARRARERDEKVDRLVVLARTRTDGADPRNIGELRDLILSAERGLAVERVSLDFRPASNARRGFGGSQVQLSMRGPVDALYTYLARVEAMALPLSPDALTLRNDGESITLGMRWNARWPTSGDATPLEPEQIAALARWLEGERKARLARNLFAFDGGTRVVAAERASTRIEARPAPVDDSPATESAQPPELPVLTGFVLARPEVEPDVKRRVLAALRYEDEVRLVMIGDAFGDYVVEGIEARESVTLTRGATGERIRLTLP